ncbi:MAG: 7,8-didemethyl-8-hydroxy-5-deazariboflavin synthase CofG [Myxococcales bacterium]|nr:7,8-didemethyl-8-hydroxy-5-deazariboflavin synthase CofG [Myxococcales bacterium]
MRTASARQPAEVTAALREVALGEPLSDHAALALSEARGAALDELLALAAARRDRAWGRTLTYSPKVFLPLTNLCRNRCDYCTFRRSPGQPGEHTMSPGELRIVFEQARAQGCVEALFCLGDTPETSFRAYHALLRSWGHGSTVDYLEWAGALALEHGLLPHTNAGILTPEDMARLKAVNVSLGLMLENVSERLCERGMPHHKAPDKRPAVRLAMTRQAGELSIPFTSGLLLGIGETRRERVETLLAIRALHREGGHIQEVIVQNFRAKPTIPMRDAPEPEDLEVAHAVALARLVLDDEVSVQAPPNLNPAATELLIAAGLNDFGGISPVTPDYINPGHPWPQIARLEAECARAGFGLRPRLPIYPRYLDKPGFLSESLLGPVASVAARLARAECVAGAARQGACDTHG